MKKVSIFAVALVGVFAMPSCKKDYTCVCTTTVPGQDPVVTTTELTDLKKSEAEDACSGNASGGGASITCELE